MKKSTLIYNPIAGGRQARREEEIRTAAELLRQAGFEITLAPTTGPGTGQPLAEAAARRGDDLVLVCGGDGTINEVANGLATGQIPLGVLPGGNANILARELRLPLNVVQAARRLPQWSPRRIALGMATWGSSTLPEGSPVASTEQPLGRRYFVTVAGVGFDAHIVYKLSSRLKLSWGVVGYIWEALHRVFLYPFPPVGFQMDGGAREATFAVVQRTRLYAGWLHLAPTADLFEPRLTLCLFKSQYWARYFLYAVAVLARQHLRLPDVELMDVKKVSCVARDAGATVRFEVDGELAGTLPAQFEVVPNALTLLVP